jgi:hypothetical protein
MAGSRARPMIALGGHFATVAWGRPTFPGLAILLAVLAIDLVRERRRDAVDSRTAPGAARTVEAAWTT